MADRTKIKLARSLKALLEEKSFNNITVQNIVDKCSVSRMTFYYYFYDTYDLAAFAFKLDADRIISENKKCDNWESGMIAALENTMEKRVVIDHVLHSAGRSHVQKYLTQALTDLLEKHIVETSCKNDLPVEKLYFLRDIYVNGVSGIIMNWMEKGMLMDPAELVNWISIFLLATKAQAFAAFEKQQEHN